MLNETLTTTRQHRLSFETLTLTTEHRMKYETLTSTRQHRMVEMKEITCERLEQETTA